MRVVRIGASHQRDRRQRNRLDAARLVGKAAGRDVIATRSYWTGGARAQARGAGWDGAERAQKVEKIIGRSVLLNNHDHMFNLWGERARFRWRDFGLCDQG